MTIGKSSGPHTVELSINHDFSTPQQCGHTCGQSCLYAACVITAEMADLCYFGHDHRAVIARLPPGRHPKARTKSPTKEIRDGS
jgi:hypothetical protein